MESRKFQKSNMNSATVDVLWDIDYHPLGSTFVSYAHTRTSARVYIAYLMVPILGVIANHRLSIVNKCIFGVGFSVVVLLDRQCESLIEWNGNSRIHAFFIYCLTS